MLILVMTT